MTANNSHTKLIGVKDIPATLGYRPPYLMIDHVSFSEGEHAVTAIKNVATNEPFFNGHFPGNPVMPGVAQLEAMLQLATIYHRVKTANRSLIPVLYELRKVKFRKTVVPGDQLVIRASVLSLSKDSIDVKVSSLVASDVASEAEMVVKFCQDLPKLADGASEFSLPVLNPSEDGNSFNITDVQTIIPHRSPFVFIDRILYNQVDNEGYSTIIGLKNVTFNEPYSLSYCGQFAFLSNTFQVEMIAQAGCVRTLSQTQHEGKFVYFISIDQAKFYQAITPGDQVYIQATISIVKERFGKGDGRIFVDGKLIAEATIKFAIIEN